MCNNIRIRFTYYQAHKTKRQLPQLPGDAVLVSRHKRALLAFSPAVQVLQPNSWRIHPIYTSRNVTIEHLQLKFSLANVYVEICNEAAKIMKRL